MDHRKTAVAVAVSAVVLAWLIARQFFSDASGDAAAGDAMGAPSLSGASATGLSSVLSSPLLADNPVFSGGVSMAIVGMLLASASAIVTSVRRTITARFTVQVSLLSIDEGFRALLVWLSQRDALLSSSKVNITVRSSDKRRGPDTKDASKYHLEFLPGAGLHFFRYKGKLMWLTRTAQEPTTEGWDKSVTTLETLTLQYMGRNEMLAEELIQEAIRAVEAKDHDTTDVYVLNRYGWRWDKANSLKPRRLDSVILDRGLAKSVVDDARRFFDTEPYYRERGIPWRRGYLLSGPPGCGKTSLCTAIAGELQLNVCVLTLSSKSLDDEDLRLRLHDAPPRSIILLEDVDSVFRQRESELASRSRWRLGGVTFSGLLNAIDGVASQEGRVLFMTTNHVERLDPALIRPGRIDVHVQYQLASSSQIRAMFSWFFPMDQRASATLSTTTMAPVAAAAGASGVDHEDDVGTPLPPPPSPPKYSRQLSDEFRIAVPEGKLSMAALQGHFMKHKNDPDGALASVKTLLRQQAQASVSSLNVERWLQRLGLEQHYPRFRAAKIFAVQDMKNMGVSDFEELGVKHAAHRRRMSAMLEGRDDVVSSFEFVTPSQAEALFLQYFGDPSELSGSQPADITAGLTLLTAAAGDGDGGAGGDGDGGGGSGAARVSTTTAAKPSTPVVAVKEHTSRVGTLAAKFRSGVPDFTLSVAQVMKLCARHADSGRDGTPDPEGPVRDLASVVAASLAAQSRRADDATMAGLGDAGESKDSDGFPESAAGGAVAAGAEAEADYEDSDVLNETSLERFLEALALEQHAAKLSDAGIATVGQLRGRLSDLEGAGMKGVVPRALVRRAMEGDPDALDEMRVVRIAEEARRVFADEFPSCRDDAVRRSFARVVPLGLCTRAQLRRFCVHHRTCDALSLPSVDGSGSRATAALQAAADAASRAAVVRYPGRGASGEWVTWDDVATWPLRKLLERLGVSSGLKAVVDAGVTTAAAATSAAAAVPLATASASMGTKNMLRGVAARDDQALRLLQLVATKAQALAAFQRVYTSAADAVARRFCDATPLGEASVAQVLAFLRLHSTSADGAEVCASTAATALSAAGRKAAEEAAAATAAKAAAVPIDEWLAALRLAELAPTFAKEKFAKAGDVKGIEEKHLAAMGVTKLGHQKRILRAAAAIA